MTQYAEKTRVPSSQSKGDIERLLMRYGASGFMHGTTADKAVVAFEAQGRRIKFLLPLPARHAKQFTHRTKAFRGRYVRTQAEADALYEQAIRQKWRALFLVIKAKLEAVESGISLFEDEFLANIVLPNGSTMGEYSRPQIEHAYQTGKMPPLLGHDG